MRYKFVQKVEKNYSIHHLSFYFISFWVSYPIRAIISHLNLTLFILQ